MIAPSSLSSQQQLHHQQQQHHHYSLSSTFPSSSSSSSSSSSTSRTSLADNAVSSRGCSRTFIVIFLQEALNYCQTLSHSPDFPFSKYQVKCWLSKAHHHCSQLTEPSPYGGIEFISNNPTSYWTEPKQFYTWWKNNIERKNKFHNLQRDAEIASNPKTLLRAYYCRTIVDLTNNIRNHFERNRITIGNTSHPGPQVIPPSFTQFCQMIQSLNRVLLYTQLPHHLESSSISNQDMQLLSTLSSTMDDKEEVGDTDVDGGGDVVERNLIYHHDIHDQSYGAFQEYSLTHEIKNASTPSINRQTLLNVSEDQRSMFTSMMKREELIDFWNNNDPTSNLTSSSMSYDEHEEVPDPEPDDDPDPENDDERVRLRVENDSDDILIEIYHTLHEENPVDTDTSMYNKDGDHTSNISVHTKEGNYPSWYETNPSSYLTIRPSPIEIDSKKFKKISHTRRGQSRDVSNKLTGYVYKHQDLSGNSTLPYLPHLFHPLEISLIPSSSTSLSSTSLYTPIRHTRPTTSSTTSINNSTPPILKSRTYTNMSDSIESTISSIDIDDYRDTINPHNTPYKSPRYHQQQQHHHHHHHESFFASTSSEFDSDGYHPVVHFDSNYDQINFYETCYPSSTSTSSISSSSSSSTIAISLSPYPTSSATTATTTATSTATAACGGGGVIAVPSDVFDTSIVSISPLTLHETFLPEKKSFILLPHENNDDMNPPSLQYSSLLNDENETQTSPSFDLFTFHSSEYGDTSLFDYEEV